MPRAAARLDRDDRLAARHLADDGREGARVAEALEVEGDDRGARILGPVRQHVVARDVGAAPDGDQRGDADAEPGEVVEHGEAERAALRQDADVARRSRSRRQRCGEANGGVGVDDAEAGRSDQPHPGSPSDAHQRRQVGVASRRGGLGEHYRAADPGLRGGGDALFERLHRRDQQRQVDRLPDRGEVGIGERGGVPARVDGVEPARESGSLQVGEQARRRGAALPALRHHRDRRGLEEVAHAARLGQQLALVGRLARALRLLGGKRDVHDAVPQRAPHQKPAGGEELEHAVVVAQDVRLELAHAVGAGDRREVLEKHRADTASLMLVGDGEGDLGAPPEAVRSPGRCSARRR